MWPKMLLEFLPHLTRLIPAADTYLNSRKESDKAHQVALASLDDTVHGGLTRLAEEQVALRRELQAHAAKSAQATDDAAHARKEVEALHSRLAAVEHTLSNAIRLLWATVGLLATVLVLAAGRLLH
jgi:hypothetical protein